MKNTLLTLAQYKIDEIGQDNKATVISTVSNIINVVVGILGLACVIIIILGGIQYMTSSGDSGKVKKAKDTILYGVIGMVICVLAFAITNFVVGAINGPDTAK